LKKDNKKWNLTVVKAKIRKTFPKTFEDLGKRIEERETREKKN